MANITIYLPKEIYEAYKNDNKRSGLIVDFLSTHYGFVIKPRTVRKKRMLGLL